jgi:hypothetical protein
MDAERNATAARRVERAWYAMHRRAGNKDGYHPTYADVHVCKRWSSLKGKENFIKDMGHPPKGTTLSRFADTGDYKPSNCAWHTPKQQCEEAKKKQRLSTTQKTATQLNKAA